MQRGRFITFEGGEGAGKSTQARLTADWLKDQGKTVILTREPGGTPGAEAIRNLLMTGEDDRWNARAEALLFAAARADHVAKLIRPALERGDWVICDRFVDSSRAYQGGGGSLSDNDVMTLHHIGSDGFLPDMTLLFTLPASMAAARAGQRDGNAPDRMGRKSTAYFERVGQRFAEIAAAEPARFRLIDGDGTIELVGERVRDVVRTLL